MNSDLILCVDGGGSKSRARLVDGAGRTLAEGEDGPCNPYTDVARAVASAAALWRRLAAASGRDPAASAHAVLAIGAAGLYVPSAREAFIAGMPPFARTVALSDGYAALIGAGGGRPCALMIVGTGVAGHRLYPDGRSVQRDAWGWVGGDRGSGAWIGRKALRHMLAALDGVRPRDALADAVLGALGGRALLTEALVGLGPDRLAALAPLVLSAAREHVASAVQIRGRALDHLAALGRVLDPGPHEAFYAAGGLAAVFAPDVAQRLGRAMLAPQADAMTGCYLVASGQAPTERVFEEAPVSLP